MKKSGSTTEQQQNPTVWGPRGSSRPAAPLASRPAQRDRVVTANPRVSPRAYTYTLCRRPGGCEPGVRPVPVPGGATPTEIVAIDSLEAPSRFACFLAPPHALTFTVEPSDHSPSPAHLPPSPAVKMSTASRLREETWRGHMHQARTSQGCHSMLSPSSHPQSSPAQHGYSQHHLNISQPRRRRLRRRAARAAPRPPPGRAS